MRTHSHTHTSIKHTHTQVQTRKHTKADERIYAHTCMHALRFDKRATQHGYTCTQEIVMYAYFKRLDYFSTECIYAPFAARGYARDFVKDLEVCV